MALAGEDATLPGAAAMGRADMLRDPLRSVPLPRPRYRLADGVTLLFLGGRKILFSERRQQLFDLNDCAAFLACRLEEGGATFGALADALAGKGVAAGAAAAVVRDLLLAWSREALLVADGVSGRAPPAHRRQSIAVAGVALSIAYGNAALSALMAPLFAHLEARPHGSSVDYEVCAADGLVLIGRQGRPAAIVTERQAAPALKALLLEEVMAGADALTALHAACLVRNGGAMLLSGAPGAGKSTLALALMATGFGYGGDDVTLLGRGALVRGLPFAPAVKAGSWRRIGHLGHALRDVPVHYRLDDRPVRYVPLRESCSNWTPFQWLILLNRQRGASPALTPCPPAQALSHLIAGASSPSGRMSIACLQSFLAMLSNNQCRTLTYSDASQAVPLLNALNPYA